MLRELVKENGVLPVSVREWGRSLKRKSCGESWQMDKRTERTGGGGNIREKRLVAVELGNYG